MCGAFGYMDKRYLARENGEYFRPYEVVDLTQPEMIGGKHYEDERGLHYYCVCACSYIKDAETIADTLNAAGL